MIVRVNIMVNIILTLGLLGKLNLPKRRGPLAGGDSAAPPESSEKLASSFFADAEAELFRQAHRTGEKRAGA